MVDRPRSFALAFVAYSVLRIAFFAVPLIVIYLLSGNAVLSTVFAAVIGLGLSVVLLGTQRTSFVSVLQERTAKRTRVSDESVEDSAVDATDQRTTDQRTTDQADSAAANPSP